MISALLFLSLLGLQDGAKQPPTIKGEIYSEFYKSSLDDYKVEEADWMLLAGELEKINQADSLGANYGPSKLSDYDLNTGWVVTSESSPLISFRLSFPENTAYEDHSPWIFNGKIILFNGYCKSAKLWLENSRIKTLNVYHNNQLICHVILKDTWHLQYFSLCDFFHDRINNNNKIRLKDGDIISLEVVETYKGSKYEDVCLSELYGEMNGGN